MPNDDRVILDDVAFAYGQRSTDGEVLASVSCEISRGEVVVAIGPNGAGKSTFLGILAGTLVPTRGSVSIFGKPARRAGIGMVWQQTYASLYPWWSAWENAALPLKLRGIRRAERRRRVESMCEELDFDQPLDRPPYELSGGEMQKLAIIRALLADPELLLMDEPFASLSFDASLELMRYMQVVHARKGITTVVVSHSPENTVFMADSMVQFRQKPIRLTPADRIVVQCRHARPRPLEWMYEADFRHQVDKIKTGESELP